MQHFRTEVPVPESAQKFSYQSRMLFMGSCFTEHIGKRLWDYKFRINLNPFGIVYNPLSIHQHIQLLLKDKQFAQSDLFYHQDLWHSFQHHGRFSGPDPVQTTKTSVHGAINMLGLAKRTNHPGVKSVATAMTQAETYGTPLGTALRTMAKENREMRLSAAEKKAAALPAKLTVPMILFFLPVLFVVMLGPAILNVMDMMKGGG